MRDQMPGFTAEASLNKTEGLYQRPNYSGLAVNSSSVVPQVGRRVCECDFDGSNCACWTVLPWGSGPPNTER